MAIQNRRGNYSDFNPASLVPGEYAVVQNGDPDGTDGCAVYMCYKSGTVKRIISEDDLEKALAEFEVSWDDVADKPSSYPTTWGDVSGRPAIVAGTGINSINEGGYTYNVASGSYSHAEGYATHAEGNYSHAEGISCYSTGHYSHSEGSATRSEGNYSHAEGYSTHATQQYSHAEGTGTYANGTASHAEGSGTYANERYTHAEGSSTSANGRYSHVEGLSTSAENKSQHVFGEYNVLDPSGNLATQRGTYVEIVGNGNSSARSNARTLDWSGNEVLAGKLTVGAGPTADMDVATKAYVDEAAGDAISFTDPNSDGNIVISLT